MTSQVVVTTRKQFCYFVLLTVHVLKVFLGLFIYHKTKALTLPFRHIFSFSFQIFFAFDYLVIVIFVSTFGPTTAHLYRYNLSRLKPQQYHALAQSTISKVTQTKDVDINNTY